MAFQGIVTGFTPNDGQGDTLLAGAIKTNNNFRELYEALGDGTSIGIATLTQLKLSGILTATSLDVPNINVSGILTAGTLTAVAVTANTFNGDFTGGTVVANALNILGPIRVNNQTRLTSGGALQNIVSVATTSLNVTGQSTLSNVTAGIVTATSFSGNVSGTASTATASATAYSLTGSPSITVTDITASGNVSIAGTLTYEDVTNVDSIGLITARNGIDVTGHTELDNLNVSGIATFNNGLVATVGVSTFSVTQHSSIVVQNMATLFGGFSASGNSSIIGDLTLTDTDGGSAAGPELKLYRNSSSPADADYLGQIKFAGENDNDEEIDYAKITGKILDASDGTEDGIIEFAHIKAGSETITGRWRSDSLQLLNGTNFSVAGDSTFTGAIDANGGADISGGLGLNVTGHTELDNVNVSGVSTFQGNVNLGDDDRLRFGDSQDLQIYHDGSTSYIRDTGTGSLVVTTNGSQIRLRNGVEGEDMANFIRNGAVELYYDNSKKFETTGYGASVFGSLGVGTDPGSNAFAVLGDARVIGILTVGESSVTIDGTNNELSVGTGVTLSHSNGIYVGDTRVHSTGFDIGSSSIHSTGATFGTFSVGIFTATVLKSTGIATFQNRIEGPGNFRVKESTGYVGINTVLPQNSLDVRGGVHIGGGDQIIIDGQDIYRQNATLNLRNQQATGGSEVQIRYQHGLSLKGGTDGTGGIELDAGRGFVKSPNGDFVIGSASTTGTDDQKLQVTGGAYISGAMGIGSVSPERKLDVMGDLKVTENAKVGGIITATSFVGDGSGLTGVIPAASAGIGFKEEGVVVGTATTINFVGVGVTATVSNGVATIDISNDPGEVTIAGISTTGRTNLSEVDISGTVNMGGNLDIVGVTTVQGGLKVSGVTTFNNNVRFPDNTPIQFGTGQDLQIYHNGANSLIKNDVGNLIIAANALRINNNNSSQRMIHCDSGAEVSLWYNGSNKLETTGYGVTVSGGIFASGIVTATQFIGDGSGLTGVTAAGSGVEIQNNGSSVGTAATINFASNVTASVTDGVATINATGGGGGGGGGISEGLAIAYAIAL